MILSFYAYQKMPLADANALSFTRTLWLVPLAAFVLKENVGPRRIAATVVGFLGALLMLQPAAQGDMGSARARRARSALLFALTVTGMKFMTRDHTTMTLMAWSAVLGFVLAIPPALFVWRWPALVDLAAARRDGRARHDHAGLLHQGNGGRRCAVMAPIDYTRLVFAIILGYLLFGEFRTPDAARRRDHHRFDASTSPARSHARQDRPVTCDATRASE